MPLYAHGRGHTARNATGRSGIALIVDCRNLFYSDRGSVIPLYAFTLKIQFTLFAAFTNSLNVNAYILLLVLSDDPTRSK